MGIFSVTNLKKLWLFLCVMLCMLGGFLLSHYLFFRTQTQELQLLQEHYQEHVDVLKRIIADVLVNSDVKPVTTQARVTAVKHKQLYQSLRSYLQQKDTNIDVHDLQEIYRSFDQTPDAQISDLQPSELKSENNENKEIIVQVGSNTAPVVRTPTRVTRVVKKKKQNDKKRLFGWPLEHDRFWVSSFFGRRKIARRKWTFHAGLDMAAIKGTPIRAAADGKVMEAGDSNNGYGNTILLVHDQGYKTRYAHLEHVRVKSKQIVHRGQTIGTVGDTGNVRGNGTDASHLHFEVHRYNRPVNPLYYLAR